MKADAEATGLAVQGTESESAPGPKKLGLVYRGELGMCEVTGVPGIFFRNVPLPIGEEGLALEMAERLIAQHNISTWSIAKDADGNMLLSRNGIPQLDKQVSVVFEVVELER